MARSFTLAEIRTRARQRADMQDSTFVTDSELNGYISASYAVLYERLVLSGIAYFESTQTINVVAGTNLYALPSNHMSTVGVDWVRSSGKFLPLRRLMVRERDTFQEPAERAVAYRLVGNSIQLYPDPSSAQTYRHIYVPAPADLTLDTDTVDGVSGWEEFIVNDAARKCLMKEESDTSALEREIDRNLSRLDEARLNRYVADAPRIGDEDDRDFLDDYEGGVEWHWRRLT